MRMDAGMRGSNRAVVVKYTKDDIHSMSATGLVAAFEMAVASAINNGETRTRIANVNALRAELISRIARGGNAD